MHMQPQNIAMQRTASARCGVTPGVAVVDDNPPRRPAQKPELIIMKLPDVMIPPKPKS